MKIAEIRITLEDIHNELDERQLGAVCDATDEIDWIDLARQALQGVAGMGTGLTRSVVEKLTITQEV